MHTGHQRPHRSGRGGSSVGSSAGRGFGHGFLDDAGLPGRAFGMARKLAAADLRLLILRLLADQPQHGYQIIKALGERSNGFYVPSPGMVYPALANLQGIGHVGGETEGRRKRYRISDAGRKHLQDRRAAADALLAQFAHVGARMARLRRALIADGDVARNSDVARGAETPPDARDSCCSAELRRAQRQLRRALDAKGGGSREQQQRIAHILNRAAAAVLGE